MGRPKKILNVQNAGNFEHETPPNVQNVGNYEHVPTKCKCGAPSIGRRDAFFAAAMAGLIARGGTSMDNLIRTAKQYADEAEATMGDA
jgi:hypothetical protein